MTLPSPSCGQDRADVEQRLRPDVDEPDLDELVDRVAQQPGRDEHERDAGPAEEGRQVDPTRAVVEPDADQRGDGQPDDRAERGPHPAPPSARRGGCLAGQEQRGLDALADDGDEREDGEGGHRAVVERAIDGRVELAADAAPPGGASRTASRSRPTRRGSWSALRRAARTAPRSCRRSRTGRSR